MMRILLTVIFTTSTVFVEGSDNGGYYTCLPTDSDTLPCEFSATSSAPFTTAIPHDIDPGIAPDGYRIVEDESGNTLSMSAKPWTNGDVLTTTCAPIYSDLYAYTLAFEMVAPLRDLMMFEPDAINSENWAALTKVFQDCKVKEEDTVDGTMNIWSTDSVYKVVTMADDNPAAGTARGGYHHGILQYLEEGAIDLVCLMCPSFTMGGDHDRCVDIRTHVGIDTSCPTRSDCWEAAYEEMYGFIPVIEETTTLEKESGCMDKDHTVTAGGCVTPVEDPVEAPVEAPVGPPDNPTTGGSTGGGNTGRSSPDGGIDTKMVKEMFLRKVGGR